MTVRFRLQLLGLSGILVILAVVALVVIESRNRAADTRRHHEQEQARTLFVEQVASDLGYGGMIHSIKNYILRGDEAYRAVFAEQYEHCISTIDARLAAPDVREDEAAAIEVIRRTVIEYRDAIATAVSMRGRGDGTLAIDDIKAIDSAVRVDDEPALAALQVLISIRDAVELENRARTQKNSEATLATAVVVGAGGVLIFAILYLSLTRSVVSPVVRLGNREELDAVLAAAILSDTPRPTILLDSDLKVLFRSKDWIEQFGDDFAALGGTFDTNAPGMPAEWDEMFARALDGERVEIPRARIRAPGRAPAWVRLDARSWTDPNTGDFGVIAVVESVDVYVELEENLRSTTEQMELAIEGTNDGIWDWPNVKESHEWWSPRFYRLLGYAPGEIPATVESFRDLLHPDHRERTFKAVEDALNGVAHFDTEYKLRCADGAYRWFRARARVFDAGPGKPLRMAGSIQDVQDRVEAQKRLVAAENELRMILDSVPSYIYYKDDNNKIIKINQTAADALGKPVEQVEGRQTEEFFPPNDAAEFLRDDRAVLESGQPLLGIEEGHEGGDGERRLIRTDKFPLKSDPDGPFDHLVAVATDITDIRRAELQFREVSERLQLALEGANQAAWDWDIANNTVVYSDSWFSMLGYEPGELPMSFDTWSLLVHPEDIKPTTEVLQAYLAGEADSYDAQLRMRCKDGTWKWIRTIGRGTEPDAAGKPQRLVGMHIDIHSLKSLQHELEAKNNEMERFVYTASHDLKSPIVTILGYLGHMLEDARKARYDEIEEFGSRIQRAASNMRENIDSLLEISRVAQGSLPAEPVSLDGAIKQSIERLELKIEDSGARIEFTPGEHQVLAAPTHVTQVVENLITNAIRHGCSNPDPVITISTRVDEQGMIELTVGDNGQGIDPDHHDRIFGLFEKLSSKKGSSGVGLAIVRRIAGLYAGRAWVDSAPNQGARFRVVLPQAPVSVGVNAGDELL